MKNILSWFASLLFLVSLSVSTTLWADDLPPICGPTGCHKPTIALVAELNR